MLIRRVTRLPDRWRQQALITSICNAVKQTWTQTWGTRLTRLTRHWSVRTLRRPKQDVSTPPKHAALQKLLLDYTYFLHNSFVLFFFLHVTQARRVIKASALCDTVDGVQKKKCCCKEKTKCSEKAKMKTDTISYLFVLLLKTNVPLSHSWPHKTKDSRVPFFDAQRLEIYRWL